MINLEFLETLKMFNGQIGNDHHGHNAGWYNINGEKIGYGDLSAKDLNALKRKLPKGDVFIALRERDSFWNFVTQHGMLGSLCKTSDREQNPGLKYIGDKAYLMVERGQIWNIKERYSDKSIGEEYEFEKVKYKVMSRKDFCERLGTSIITCKECGSENVDCRSSYDREDKKDYMSLYCFGCNTSYKNPY